MTQPKGDQDLQLQQTLDRLGVAPQQLLDFHQSLADRVASTPEWLNPNLYRSGGPGARPLRSWHINPERLDASLRGLLDPLGVGFCYMLTRRGAPIYTHKVGDARLATPEIKILSTRIAAIPAVAWNFDVPTDLCSVSKLITAIAVVMLLRDAGLDPRTPVVGFLPDYWAPHWSTGKITFRDLLRHESGLGWILNTNGVPNTNSGPGDFTNARIQMGWGGGATGLGTFDYKNCNYAVLRATFPIVAGAMDPALSLIGGPGINDALWDLTSATVYRDFVNDRIFAAAGVGPFDFKGGSDATRAYPTPPSLPGAQLADVTSNAGSGGWYLGLEELMRVVARFRHGGVMMTSGQAQRLLASRYGVAEIFDTNAGAVYAKRGRYNDGGSNTLDTAIYIMPDALELGVFINSGPGSGPNQASHNDGIQQLIINSAEAGP